MKRTIEVLVLAASVVGAVSKAEANPDAYNRLVRSTVWIVAGDDQPDSMGTGVVLDKELGLIATAAHVVAGKSAVLVFFPVFDDRGDVLADRKQYLENVKTLMEIGVASPAESVSSSGAKDLAILRVKRMPRYVTAVPIAERARRGESVHVVGNPDISKSLFAYSGGPIRAIRHFESKGSNGSPDESFLAVEYDANTSSGNSGGPVVNDRGELVAIVSGSIGRKENDVISYKVAVGVHVDDLRPLVVIARNKKDQSAARPAQHVASRVGRTSQEQARREAIDASLAESMRRVTEAIRQLERAQPGPNRPVREITSVVR